MLKIKSLTKKYNNKIILRNLNFEFKDKNLYYIIGKSGCGKSTLLYLLSGLDNIYEGNIYFRNKDISTLKNKEKEDFLFYNISFAFQDYKINNKKKVIDLIQDTLSISTISKEEKEKRLNYYLTKVGLLSKKNSLFSKLSGGEKKRILLVSALIKDSDIVFIDEPTSSLNKVLRKQINELILEESKKRLVIVITHDEDDIVDNSNILILKNGTLEEKKKYINKSSSQIISKSYKRKKYGGSAFFKNIIKELKLKKEYFYLSLTSLVIGLFTLTFSLLLSQSVTDSLNNSLSKYMNANTLVIRKKENDIKNESYSLPNEKILNNMCDEFNNLILTKKDFYVTNVDKIINSNQRISINYDNKFLINENLTLESFIECNYLDEVDINNVYVIKDKLNYDEIILSLDQKNIDSLCYFLTRKKYINNDINIINEMLETLNDNIISLQVEASKIEWQYYLDYSYRIVGFHLGQSNNIISDDYNFNSNFVKNVLSFKERFVGEKIYLDYPAVLEKEVGIIIKPNFNAEFIAKYLTSSYQDQFALDLNQNPKHFIKSDYSTYNRFFIYQDYINKFSFSDINKFIKNNINDIYSANYSTPVYTYTSSGYISGFTKPFFFSKYKNKLIEIEGTYNYASENIGQLQSSSIVVDDDVFKADLFSSINNTGLKFVPLNQNDNKLIYGSKPSSFNEILISTKFARSLGNNLSELVGIDIHTLVLDKTIKIGNGYQNQFVFNKIKVSGIYEEDELSISQDSLFPFAHLFSCTYLESQDIAILDCVIEVNLDDKSPEYYINELRKYGDYKGSFPMLQMIKEVNNTMDRIKKVFSILSSTTLAVSFFLIILSIYLIIEKDKKEIGVFLTLGYKKKDIVRYYLTLCSLIGLISFIISFIMCLFSQRIISEQLNIMLNNYTYSVQPYLISFLVSQILTLLIGLTSIFPIYRLNIKETLFKY